MGDEEDIRELIGRMSAAQRQGFHVMPAGIKIVLIALRFYLATRTWLAKSHADPHDDAPRKRPEKYTGPLPTVADSRRLGLTACLIQCSGPNCWHETRFTFDQLGVSDDTIFIHIPKLRRFRCKRCGCRSVTVSADWADYVAQGNGMAAGQLTFQAETSARGLRGCHFVGPVSRTCVAGPGAAARRSRR